MTTMGVDVNQKNKCAAKKSSAMLIDKLTLVGRIVALTAVALKFLFGWFDDFLTFCVVVITTTTIMCG